MEVQIINTATGRVYPQEVVNGKTFVVSEPNESFQIKATLTNKYFREKIVNNKQCVIECHLNNTCNFKGEPNCIKQDYTFNSFVSCGKVYPLIFEEPTVTEIDGLNEEQRAQENSESNTGRIRLVLKEVEFRYDPAKISNDSFLPSVVIATKKFFNQPSIAIGKGQAIGPHFPSNLSFKTLRKVKIVDLFAVDRITLSYLKQKNSGNSVSVTTANHGAMLSPHSYQKIHKDLSTSSSQSIDKKCCTNSVTKGINTSTVDDEIVTVSNRKRSIYTSETIDLTVCKRSRSSEPFSTHCEPTIIDLTME